MSDSMEREDRKVMRMCKGKEMGKGVIEEIVC